MDRIEAAECLDESFTFATGISLANYAAKAFGAYQDASQYGEVTWRLLPQAAGRAAEFQFYPETDS